MTQPAEITSHYDWRDLIDALRETVNDVRSLREVIAELRELRQQEEDLMTDPGHDLDAELEEERRTRLDYETDGRLDGDYDPERGDADYDLDLED